MKAWTWIRENSDGIGVILSVIGFGVLWYQTWKTRRAADAARIASAQAIDSISSRQTIADLALMRAELEHVQLAIRGRHYEAALLHIQGLRERFHQLRSRRGFTTEKRHLEIQDVVTFLKKLQDTLEREISNPTQKVIASKINGHLADIGTKTAEWSEEARFELGGPHQ